MSILELGALGEFVSSFAVFATLVYLAVQLRQTKRSVQSASLQNALASMNQVTQNVASDPGLAEIVGKGFVNSAQLDSTQWLRFGFVMTGIFHVFQQHFLDSENKLGDPRVWAGEERAMRQMLAMPGIEAWWSEFPSRPYSDDFNHLVDSILHSAKETDEWRKYRERRAEND